MDNLSFQRVPGQDLPENGSFAFVPHKEFINRIPRFVLVFFWLSPKDPWTLFTLPADGKHIAPPENAFGRFQKCQNGRLGGAAVTAKVRTRNPLRTMPKIGGRCWQ